MSGENLAEMYSHVFEEFETIADIDQNRTPYMNVSVFDHWLNEKEADDCEILAYSIAIKRGRESDYLSGEQRFLQLYRELGEGGIIVNVPSPLREYDQNGRETDEIIRNSLREIKLMDVFFKKYSVRVLGGYDRTDIFIFHDGMQCIQVKKLIEDLGRFFTLC